MTVDREQDASNPVRNLGSHFPQVRFQFLHQRHPEWPTELYSLDILSDRFLVRHGQGLQPSPDRLSPRACPKEDNIQLQVSDAHFYYCTTIGAPVKKGISFFAEQFEDSAERSRGIILVELSRGRALHRSFSRGVRGSRTGSNWPSRSDTDEDSFLGKLRARTGALLDLPTETQWEYACRAGADSALHNGKDLTRTDCSYDPGLNEVGRYCGNGMDTTEAVGKKQANAWGLYDMHGNVWEWCLDWYADYRDGPADPKGARSGSKRVVRGGSWSASAKHARAANRLSIGPDYQAHNLGLRLAMPQ